MKTFFWKYLISIIIFFATCFLLFFIAKFLGLDEKSNLIPISALLAMYFGADKVWSFFKNERA